MIRHARKCKTYRTIGQKTEKQLPGAGVKEKRMEYRGPEEIFAGEETGYILTGSYMIPCVYQSSHSKGGILLYANYSSTNLTLKEDKS